MSKQISYLSASTLIATPEAQITIAAPRGRLSLRLRKGLTACDKALGVKLPRTIGARGEKNGIEVVCLGPDEWTIVTDLDRVAGIQSALASIYPDHPHALTDITHRELSFVIAGKSAMELLTIGCARDLASFEIGSARRILFDVATTTLWRDGENTFRLDVWNSFVPFIAQTLITGTKEITAEQAARATTT